MREPPSEVLISDPKVNQPKQARRPRMRIQRAHDRALAMAMAPPWPTGRGRMPEGPRSAMARAHGVFSEMPSRHRALGDGGAGQVHGPASVRLEPPLASGRDATGPRGARGESLS